ncbi:MAG: hypothetical protein HC842_03480 [Cytophagales bacterium]|nr:hypothetical protein [Cytophagales bacterium]
MRKHTIPAIVCAFLGLYPLLAKAQCQDGYYLLTEGAQFEMSNYDHKERYQGKALNKVLKREKQGNEEKVVFQSNLFDKANKSIGEGEFDIVCEGSSIRMNVKNLLPREMLSQYENMDVEIESDDLFIPHSLQIGQDLPPASSRIKVTMGPGVVSTITVDIKGRKVERQEEVTTVAGTFSTYKVAEQMEVSTDMMGMKHTFTTKSETWYAKGIGAVKTITYDKKGAVSSTSLLTGLKK